MGLREYVIIFEHLLVHGPHRAGRCQRPAAATPLAHLHIVGENITVFRGAYRDIRVACAIVVLHHSVAIAEQQASRFDYEIEQTRSTPLHCRWNENTHQKNEHGSRSRNVKPLERICHYYIEHNEECDELFCPLTFVIVNL